RRKRFWPLHDQFVRAASDRVLHLLQIVLYPVQTEDTLLEVLRQGGEQWRDFRVLEVLELGDDVVALLAGFHHVDEVLNAMATKPKVIDALREHSREEQCVVADVFAHLALAVK